MAPSRKNQTQNSPDGNPAPPPRPVLWSRIHQVAKSSLMYNDEVTTSTDGFTTIKSLCYRVARSPGCILFDVTSRPEDQAAFLQILATQFPKLWGVAFHQENKKRRIIEIGFLDDTARNQALNTGMVFDNEREKVRILPIRALSPDTNIVRLALSNLPFIDPEALRAGIRTSLKPFGHIVDVGLSYDKVYKLYIGQGYAVLDIYQPHNIDSESKYQPLVHNLPWRTPRADDDREDMDLDDPSLYTRDAGFYATWNNMHTWCTYCHDESGDHTANNCKLRPGYQTEACWQCHEVGHKKETCTSPKKAKKGSLPTTQQINEKRQESQRPSRGRRRSSRSPDRNPTLYDHLADKLDNAKNKDAMDVEESNGSPLDAGNASNETADGNVDTNLTPPPATPFPLSAGGPGDPSNPKDVGAAVEQMADIIQHLPEEGSSTEQTSTATLTAPITPSLSPMQTASTDTASDFNNKSTINPPVDAHNHMNKDNGDQIEDRVIRVAGEVPTKH